MNAVWMPLTSSNLDAYRYNEDEQSLDLRYRGGRDYRYAKVTKKEVEAMLAADSIGSHVSRILRPLHQCTELPPDGVDDE